MPFNPCGRGVDYLEDTVTDTIRPFRDSAITVRRRWYRVPEGTPLLGFPSAFLSAHYEAYPWYPRNVGEVYPPLDLDYTRRGTPAGLTFDHVCGTVEDFQLGAVFDPTLNVLYDAEWIPLCCGRAGMCVTQLCGQAQVNERPAMQLISYPVQHQQATDDTPFHLFQVAANQGAHDPAWPGWLVAWYPEGVNGPPSYTFEQVNDENGIPQFQEEMIRFAPDNSITQTQDASGFHLFVEQGGVTGEVIFAIVDGVLTMSGTNFQFQESLLPSVTCYTDIVNEFTQNQVIGPETAETAGVQPVLDLDQHTTGTPGPGFGQEILFSADTDDGTAVNPLRETAAISADWFTATDASRKGRLNLYVFDTAKRTLMTGRASGTAPMLGFFGASPVAQPGTSGGSFGFTQNSGTTVFDGSTFAGITGGTAYTIDEIVGALKKLGILKS